MSDFGRVSDGLEHTRLVQLPEGRNAGEGDRHGSMHMRYNASAVGLAGGGGGLSDAREMDVGRGCGVAEGGWSRQCIAPDDGPGGGSQRAPVFLVSEQSVFGLSCTCSLITPSSSSRLLQYH